MPYCGGDLKTISYVHKRQMLKSRKSQQDNANDNVNSREIIKKIEQ